MIECAGVLADERIGRFMNKFFEENPGDAVRIETVRQIEVIGDGAIPFTEA